MVEELATVVVVEGPVDVVDDVELGATADIITAEEINKINNLAFILISLRILLVLLKL